MQTKRCSKCKQEKPVSEFGKKPKSKSGYGSHCKQCNCKYNEKYRDTIQGIYNAIKARQRYLKKKNDPTTKPFVVSFNEFKELFEKETKCHYCHLPVKDWHKIIDSHLPRTKRLSVDCMNNELGYVSGNIVLACYRCNNIKNNFFSYEDFKEIAEKYIKPVWEKQLGHKLS